MSYRSPFTPSMFEVLEDRLFMSVSSCHVQCCEPPPCVPVCVPCKPVKCDPCRPVKCDPCGQQLPPPADVSVDGAPVDSCKPDPCRPCDPCRPSCEEQAPLVAVQSNGGDKFCKVECKPHPCCEPKCDPCCHKPVSCKTECFKECKPSRCGNSTPVTA